MPAVRAAALQRGLSVSPAGSALLLVATQRYPYRVGVTELGVMPGARPWASAYTNSLP